MTTVGITGQRENAWAVAFFDGASLPAKSIFAAIGLLLCAVLLVSFYNVTRQAVAQGQAQWGRAIEASAACGSLSAAGDDFACSHRGAQSDSIAIASNSGS